MGNPKRTQKDIKQIRVFTEIQGVHGWVVEMQYKDGKSASFAIDYGKKGFDMLAEVSRCIKLQLKGTSG